MAAGSHTEPRRPRRSWPQRLLITSGVLVCLACLTVASGVGYVYWKFGKLTHYSDIEVAEAPPGSPQNYLVVGSDSRDNIDPSDPNADAFLGESVGGKRTDTIMVVRIDPIQNTAALLSFPRDLWVTIADTGGSNRINSAYGRGRQVLIDTIQQNFGIEIHHYIEVDFKGFQGVVNAVGGVPVYFDTPMRDGNSGLNVPEGCVTLDGFQALAFARARHLEYQDSRGRWQTDPTGDLGRITRQQVFMRRALDRAYSAGLSNPVTFNQLLDVAVNNVGVDEGLDAGDLLNLARRFQDYKGDELQTYSLPVVGDRTSGGASIVRLVEDDATPILNIFRGLPPDAISEAQVTVTVLNGTGAPRQAADVAAAIEAVGFERGSIGDARGQPWAQTVVRYAPGSLNAADLVARHLTSRALLEEDAALGDREVVLITGTDFSTVMVEPWPTTTTTAPPATTGGSQANGATTTSTVPSSSTTVVGRAPGEPPEGVSC